ncbi:MAG: hypothetical protein SOX43_07060 [Pelistega sp.]|nr:hypothetical protein [Pelistega sp.]
MTNYFDDVQFDGASYSLEHLNPIYIEFFGKKIERNLRVKVLYSNHCFTARVDRLVANSVREFSLQRYELSKLLPSIIQSMNDEKVQVLQTLARRNFAYVIQTQLNEKNYNIFFELQRANQRNQDCDLVMRIESAYVFDGDKEIQYSGKIRFLILCQKIYLGEKIQCRK